MHLRTLPLSTESVLVLVNVVRECLLSCLRAFFVRFFVMCDETKLSIPVFCFIILTECTLTTYTNVRMRPWTYLACWFLLNKERNHLSI
jgi:hypothetical protein